MKIKLLFVLLLASFILISGCIQQEKTQTKPENQLFGSSKVLPQNQQNFFPNQNQDSSRYTGKRCIHNEQPIFTNYFIDLDKVEHVTPIGGIRVGSQSRSYVFAKQDTGVHAPIYAPINSTLVQITYANRHQLGRAEYRLDFEVSCEVSYTFDHLSDVSKKI